jgi:hypothetical protein
MRKIDLLNKRYGSLLVIKEAESDKYGHSRYLCKCDCGNEIIRAATSLNRNQTFSCGCKRTKHGMSRTKLYRIWADMIQRCENENSTNYKYYGAKGVSVLSEWKDFEKFKTWALSNGYEKGLSIDRIDPFLNYEPSNCKWSTREEQDNNKRNSVKEVVKGELLTLSQIAKKYNFGFSTISHRYNVGVRGDDLIQPSNRGRKLRVNG